MLIRRIAATAVLGLCTSLSASAQTAAQHPAGGPPPDNSGIAPGSQVDPAKSFDAAVTGLEKLWMGAANAMPADKYSFAPSKAIFVPTQAVKFDTVRTYAQLVTHTIVANYGYFSRIGGIKPDVDINAINNLTSKDDIVKALAATFVFAHKAVANVTTANAFESLRGPQTRATALAGAIAHGEDEYGQAVEYLRMNAIIPPASAPREP